MVLFPSLRSFLPKRSNVMFFKRLVRKKKTAPRICLLQQIHGAIIYRGYQFKEISTVMMQASIQTPSGIYIMYHDAAYHDAGHGYEEIL